MIWQGLPGVRQKGLTELCLSACCGRLEQFGEVPTRSEQKHLEVHASLQQTYTH